MIEEKLAQVDLAVQRRNNFEAKGKFVGMQISGGWAGPSVPRSVML